MNAPPITMRVAVEVGYVNTCQECVAIVEATASAAFRDAQVTKFVAVPGSKHAHLEATPIARIEANGQQSLPISDVNGSEPKDVDENLRRMLDHEMGVGA